MHTKIIALSYGMACLAIAFSAQYLGGILQASLTIFGVVGGPLLALFSLGMFTVTANQKVSFIGILYKRYYYENNFSYLGCSYWLSFWTIYGSLDGVWGAEAPSENVEF